ncbi:mechanosensitive ion channel family protein [Rhizobium sp. RU20A]|uniref:mechanosensitive ion channel family protein n=1 Tax=Rhizobium sp. RU20A TaxID=1907412 RepID=UPI00122C7657|nr:mechanosensitive ion channel family protein [Rhizobium sp. RU20A]
MLLAFLAAFTGAAGAQTATQPAPLQQIQQIQKQLQQPAQNQTPAASAAPAGDGASRSESSAQVSAELEQEGAELKKLTAAFDAARDDDVALSELKVSVDALARQILTTSAATRPRLEEIKGRLSELGEPPAEGQPPEAAAVTEERQRLMSERNDINALTGQAENLSVSATRLSNAITATRRTLFSKALFGVTQISGEMFSTAAAAFSVEMQQLGRSLTSWVSFSWSYKRVSLLGAIFLSLCLALVFLAGSKRLFASIFRRDPEDDHPSYFRRLSVAFWSTMLPTLSVAAFAVTSYLCLDGFNVLRSDIAPLVSNLLGTVVAVLFVTALSQAVLAPAHPHWRLVAVSDSGARVLTGIIFTMVLINGVDYLLAEVSEVFGSPVVLTVVKSFFASILIALVVIGASMVRPLPPADDDLNARARRWPRYISTPLFLIGIALIAAALTGYVGLARFIATQITITGAIAVVIYIGMLAGRELSRQGAFADTAIGSRLEKRFGLSAVALDQIGLAASLGTYALVISIFVPLLFLQWGFQIADIQSWAYRIVTDIRIGNITISLAGILAGLLFFAIGYSITRWFQRWLDSSVMALSRVDTGVRNSVRTGVGYLGVGLAGLVAISAAGIDLSSLALVAGALSLGVGFGLQNIVSNFVSGLILLVERPFKVGDWVTTGTTEGFVKRISVRATEIETFQRQSIMVPNSLFINAPVGNWTHRNRLGRADIAVTVGYDANPRRILEILADIADKQPQVLKNPAPMTVFAGFGDERMTFEVRVFLADIVSSIGVRNDIRLQIFERFREEGIAKPFAVEDVVADADAATTSVAPAPAASAAVQPVSSMPPVTQAPVTLPWQKAPGTR